MISKVHIVIHSQYYPPEVGAPQTRLHELAVGLMRQGIQVTVLTAMPSYPLGRIYDGYKGWLKVEYIDGIKTIRTAIYPTQNTSMLPRLLSYLSFILSSLVIGSWKVGRADFLLTESPPLFLGLGGFLLSRWKKASWILNISDLWPESVAELGIISRKSLGYKLGGILEAFLYRKAWMVSCQSRTILENIQERFSNVHLYHLPNGVDTNLFQPGDWNSGHNNFHIVYAGLHGLAQGLEQIIFAARELLPSGGIDFTLVGDGPEKERLIRLAKDLGLDQVRFLGPVAKEKIPAILNGADVVIVPLKIQLTGAVPSKLYEAMAIGKPVILIAGNEAARIVNEASCGIVVCPGDIDGLVSAIAYIRNHPEESRQMGVSGRRISVQNHDRAIIVGRFAGLLTRK